MRQERRRRDGGGVEGKDVIRNYDEQKCDWGKERGGERKGRRVRISEIIMLATSPRAYCTVHKVASSTHTHTHTV